MTKSTEILKSDPLELVLQRVDGKYRYPARRFVEYLQATGSQLGDPTCWDVYLKSLTRVQATGKMRRRRYSAATYNNRLAALKAVVKVALSGSALVISDAQARVVRDRLDELKGRKMPDPASGLPEKLMSAEEVQMLIDQVQLPNWGLRLVRGEPRKPRPDIALMIEFLWETGVRVSEMLNVLLTDCTRTNSHYQVRILGKGSKERFQAVSADLVHRIREQFHGEVYLFESRNQGKGPEPDYRYARTTVSQTIHRIGWTLLRRKISAHALRHSSITHYISITKDLEATQRFAGHSSSATTAAYYVHRTNDPVRTLEIMRLPNGHNIQDRLAKEVSA